MAKMKVHELAKELDIQSKDIIAFLNEKGIEVKAAQSSVEDDAIALVKGKFGKKAAPKAEAPKTEAAKETPVKASPVKEEAAKDAPAKPQAKPEGKPVQAEAPKKKKIIMVSNPHNSNMPGQRPAQGGQRPMQGGARPQGQARPQAPAQGGQRQRPNDRTISGSDYAAPRLIKVRPDALNRSSHFFLKHI